MSDSPDRDSVIDTPARRLLAGALVTIFLGKALTAIGPFFMVRLPAALAASFQDAFLVLLLFGCFVALGRHGRRIGRTFPMAVSATMALTGLYTPFLFDLMNFSLNLFELTGTMAAFFLRNFIGPGIVASVVGSVVGPFLAAHLLPPTWCGAFPGRWWSAAISVGFLASLGFGPVHPLLQSLREEARGVLARAGDTAVPSLRLPLPGPDQNLPQPAMCRPFTAYPSFVPRYQRVAMFVMEGLNHESFPTGPDQIADMLGGSGFGCERFTSHFSLNLDSLPSLVAMLNSVFVPYQAYLNLEKYEFLQARPNLVDCLAANGFQSHFIASFGRHHLPFVPVRAAWSSIELVDDVTARPGFVAVTTNPVEWACEDLAVLDQIIAALRRGPRVMTFQEMVYGHTEEWVTRKGLAPDEYYRRYLWEFLRRARENDLLDGLLVVIVADHGPRGDPADPESYRVPMLLCAKDLASRTIDTFQSHLDLKDILMEKVAGISRPSPVSSVATMGHTGRLVYGRVTDKRKFVFIDNRTRHVVTNADEDEVQRCWQAFQEYLEWFSNVGAREAAVAGRLSREH